MKHINFNQIIFLTICLLSITLLCSAQSNSGHGLYKKNNIKESIKMGDKAAILIVHFGTTYPDTEKKTIQRVNEAVKKRFSDFEVREAYSSRIVAKILNSKGIKKENPTQALERLYKEGYTHVVVQSTFMIEGVETEALREECRRFESKFKDIRCSNPILYFPEDYYTLTNIISKSSPTKEYTLFIGHGSYDPATAQYSMLSSIFRDSDKPYWFVTTIEGYPNLDITLKEIANSNFDKTKDSLTLQPLMFVAGDHAQNDIGDEMRELLISKGYKIKTNIVGLGELYGFDSIIINKIYFEVNHLKNSITNKKNSIK